MFKDIILKILDIKLMLSLLRTSPGGTGPNMSPSGLAKPQFIMYNLSLWSFRIPLLCVLSQLENNEEQVSVFVFFCIPPTKKSSCFKKKNVALTNVAITNYRENFSLKCQCFMLSLIKYALKIQDYSSELNVFKILLYKKD